MLSQLSQSYSFISVNCLLFTFFSSPHRCADNFVFMLLFWSPQFCFSIILFVHWHARVPSKLLKEDFISHFLYVQSVCALLGQIFELYTMSNCVWVIYCVLEKSEIGLKVCWNFFSPFLYWCLTLLFAPKSSKKRVVQKLQMEPNLELNYVRMYNRIELFFWVFKFIVHYYCVDIRDSKKMIAKVNE